MFCEPLADQSSFRILALQCLREIVLADTRAIDAALFLRSLWPPHGVSQRREPLKKWYNPFYEKIINISSRKIWFYNDFHHILHVRSFSHFQWFPTPDV